MKSAKCKKGFLVEKRDDNGFLIENKYMDIKEGLVWDIDEDAFRVIDGEIRLTSNKGWLELSKETFDEHFEIVQDTEGWQNFNYWTDGKRKANNSPRAKKLMKKLEELGHTNVYVWWEPLGPCVEMAGPEGGYMYCSDQRSMEPIGYSFDEAYEMIQNKWHRSDYRQ